MIWTKAWLKCWGTDKQIFTKQKQIRNLLQMESVITNESD